MERKIFPSSLYNFLRFANREPVEKKILDCGAGGEFPKLALFKSWDYESFGIDISEEGIEKAREYFKKNEMEVELRKGDMRNIPYDDKSFGYVYSYNSVFHLSKKDSGEAINEMYRVLKNGGLCFVNFISKEDSWYGDGEEVNPGEFIQKESHGEVLHSYYDDEEPDPYFNDFEIIFKQKKKVFINNIPYLPCYIEYIVRKEN
jgi:ubiquinone/menaquinone biosynthesis C-methylase UbiE